MAKRSMKTHAKVTPFTKGAATRRPTPRPEPTFDTSTFPFKIPRPSGAAPNAEEALFSQPSEAGLTPAQQRMQQGRQPDVETVAQRRQRALSRIPTAAELDALGEADPHDLTADREEAFDGGEQDDEPESEQEDSGTMSTQAQLERQLRDLREQMAVLLAGANKGVAAPPSKPAQAPAYGVTVRAVTFADTDNLWDWIRRDDDAGRMFLGAPVDNSLELHQRIQRICEGEASGVAMLRSIYWEDDRGLDGVPSATHLGFGMVYPILSHEKIAVLHTYLRQDARGYLLKFLPALLQLAQDVLPPGFRLAVVPFDEHQRKAFATLLQPLGFTAHTMFVRQ